MSENEYIPKDEKKKTVKKKPSSRSKGVRKKTSAKSKRKKLFDRKKIKTIFGTLLLVGSIFLLISCISYLFTWKEDQDRILNKSLVDFIFGESGENVQNWLGKLGAFSSHKLMYNTFGLSSIAFCLLFVLYGLRILFNINQIPLKSYTLKTIFLGTWLSLFLGYFSSSITFLGGSIGFYTNEWLVLSLGNAGALLIYLGLLYILITVLFNPNYSLLLNLFKRTNVEEIEDSEEQDNDFNVINTITDDEIKEEEISETIEFGENDNDSNEKKNEDELLEKETLKDEFEIEVPKEEKLVESSEPSKVEENPDDLSAQLLKDIGEYDPKLDLSDYTLPPIDLLKDYGGGSVSIDKEELETNKDRIVETLANYKIAIAKIKATVGPTVTLYELVPAPGIRISKIKNLEDDIALSLSALGIRIIAPIPGKGTIGIEVPNSKPDMVSMRSLIASEKFQNSDAELPVVLGKTITNETYCFDLTKMPHLLVAGATGQGKSVGLNAILISLLYKKHPAQIKFVLVDPKKVELTLYNKIERHFLAKLPDEEDAIITDTSKVVNTLNSLCSEMDDRYELCKIALEVL